MSWWFSVPSLKSRLLRVMAVKNVLASKTVKLGSWFLSRSLTNAWTLEFDPNRHAFFYFFETCRLTTNLLSTFSETKLSINQWTGLSKTQNNPWYFPSKIPRIQWPWKPWSMEIDDFPSDRNLHLWWGFSMAMLNNPCVDDLIKHGEWLFQILTRGVWHCSCSMRKEKKTPVQKVF